VSIKAGKGEVTAADAAVALGWSAQRVIYMIQKGQLAAGEGRDKHDRGENGGARRARDE